MVPGLDKGGVNLSAAEVTAHIYMIPVSYIQSLTVLFRTKASAIKCPLNKLGNALEHTRHKARA